MKDKEGEFVFFEKPEALTELSESWQIQQLFEGCDMGPMALSLRPEQGSKSRQKNHKDLHDIRCRNRMIRGGRRN